MSNLTKLFTLFTTIEREYGIASLEKGEREILNLIVSAEEQKKEMSAEELVDLNVASRATIYRRLSSLKESGLVSINDRSGKSILGTTLKFKSFAQSLNFAAGMNNEGT
jgi:DNA-binding IclR family transcriptional regulator